MTVAAVMSWRRALPDIKPDFERGTGTAFADAQCRCAFARRMDWRALSHEKRRDDNAGEEENRSESKEAPADLRGQLKISRRTQRSGKRHGIEDQAKRTDKRPSDLRLDRDASRCPDEERRTE